MTADASGSLLVFLVAGEPSGDVLGGRLMAALRSRHGNDIRFVGVGGDRMMEQGLQEVFPLDDIAVMGLLEVVPRLPLILRRIRETADAVASIMPDILVTIDSPDFSFRVARRLARRHSPVPRVHYVAPTVWAWRAGRARCIAAFYDHLLALFPFEPVLFEAAGLPCTYVGHPAIETALPGDGPAFRRQRNIDAGKPILTVLPGSRLGEVTRHLPIFRGAVERLAHDMPDLEVVMPTVSTVAEFVENAVADWSIPIHLLRDEAAKRGAFAASRAALAASGTVALELALAGLPMVIGYRLSRVTGWLARRLVRVPYVSPVNLVLDRAAVPELLLDDCRPDRLAEALMPLLRGGAARDAQVAALHEAYDKLQLDGPMPSDRAAKIILGLIE